VGAPTGYPQVGRPALAGDRGRGTVDPVQGDASIGRQQLLRLAGVQMGHVAAWQVRVLGFTDRWLEEQHDRHGWVHVHHGVARLPDVPTTDEGTVWAALLTVGTLGAPRRAASVVRSGMDLVAACVHAVSSVAAATGWTGARLLGSDGPWPVAPQLVAAHGTVSRVDDVRLIRTRVGAVDSRMVGGVPCAPPERVAWDCGWIARADDGVQGLLRPLLVLFDRTRVLAIDELLAVVDEPPAFELPNRVPGELRRVAEALRPGFSHSAAEAELRGIAEVVCSRRGFEVATRPLAVRHDGRIIAEADVAVPALRWDLECDGPHHRHPAVRRRDRRRDARLDVLVDWWVTRYDVDRLEDRAELRRAVGRDLDARLRQLERRAA
jgi:hypothetical protein